MASAKIVAQKSFGRVIPPLSPGQEAPGWLVDAVWLDDGVVPAICRISARTLVNTPAGQPGFVDSCGIALLLMAKRQMRLQGPIGTPVMTERQPRRTVGGWIEKMRKLPLRDPCHFPDLGDGRGLGQAVPYGLDRNFVTIDGHA